MSIQAEIISIGSELTNGRNLDTNSQWLSKELANLGVPVLLHTTVADDLQANIELFQVAAKRSDLVILTGGLGPTQDDLTREALAAVAGVEFEFHEPSFQIIESMFTKRNREMPERNRVQAMFPVGSEPIPNRHGTAPGIWMRVPKGSGSGAQRDAVFVAMPGVPSEMFRMFTDDVRPRLITHFGLDSVIVHRKINTFGTGESHLEEKLMDLTQRGRAPEVGITASDATISLRISAEAATEAEALQLIEPTAQIIYQRVGRLIYGEGDAQLQDIVADLLRARGMTIATAEGYTGGLLSQRLTEIPGSSQWYRGGVVAYSNQVKENALGIPGSLIETHGAVSGEVAEAMARSCHRRFAADLGVATVGIAGPDGGSDEKPVGTVLVGLASAERTISKQVTLFGGREAIRSRGVKHALNQVRLWLRGDDP